MEGSTIFHFFAIGPQMISMFSGLPDDLITRKDLVVVSVYSV